MRNSPQRCSHLTVVDAWVRHVRTVQQQRTPPHTLSFVSSMINIGETCRTSHHWTPNSSIRMTAQHHPIRLTSFMFGSVGGCNQQLITFNAIQKCGLCLGKNLKITTTCLINNLWKQLVCRRVCPSPRLPISKFFGHFWIWCNQFSFSLQNSYVSPGPRIVDHVMATFFVLNVMVSFHRFFSSAHVDIVLVSFISQFLGIILVHG